jgi:hypothetical protein
LSGCGRRNRRRAHNRSKRFRRRCWRGDRSRSHYTRGRHGSSNLRFRNWRRRNRLRYRCCGLNRRMSRWRCGCALLLANNRFQHISRLGDMGKIDLRLYPLGFRATDAGRPCGGVTLASSTEMGADLLSLVLLERAGVRFLLGNANFLQNIEDRLTFDFQFSGQVVNSNLTHPPLVSSAQSR